MHDITGIWDSQNYGERVRKTLNNFEFGDIVRLFL